MVKPEPPHPDQIEAALAAVDACIERLDHFGYRDVTSLESWPVDYPDQLQLGHLRVLRQALQAWQEHSQTLNQVAYTIAVTLGRVTPGQPITANPLDLLDDLTAHPRVPGLVEVNEATYTRVGPNSHAAVMTHWPGPNQNGRRHYFVPQSALTDDGDPQ